MLQVWRTTHGSSMAMLLHVSAQSSCVLSPIKSKLWATRLSNAHPSKPLCQMSGLSGNADEHAVNFECLPTSSKRVRGSMPGSIMRYQTENRSEEHTSELQSR